MFATTREFIDVLKIEGVRYEITWENEDGSDCVSIRSKCDKSNETFELDAYFYTDPDKVSLQIDQVCMVPAGKLGQAMVTINDLNRELYFVKFFLVSNDGSLSVTAESDHCLGNLYRTSGKDGSYIDKGTFCVSHCINLFKTVDNAYLRLMRAIWSD